MAPAAKPDEAPADEDEAEPEPTEDRPEGAPRCGTCGLWDSGAQYGLDHTWGWCLHWEKLTERDFGCEHYVEQEEFKRRELAMAEEMGLVEDGDEDVW